MQLPSQEQCKTGLLLLAPLHVGRYIDVLMEVNENTFAMEDE